MTAVLQQVTIRCCFGAQQAVVCAQHHMASLLKPALYFPADWVLLCALLCFAASRNEQRHQEYLERQAARAARDDVVKPKKFEHEVG